MAQATIKINIDHYLKTHLHVMVIMRGVPGSGKSYAAEETLKRFEDKCRAVIHSSDVFFTRNPEKEYRFNPAALGIAHKWNQNNVLASLKGGVNLVIVDNTNTTWKEIEPYAKMAHDNGYFVIIAETDTPWAKDVDECVKRNQHNVPREAIERMLARWQSTDTIIEKLNGLVNS